MITETISYEWMIKIDESLHRPAKVSAAKAGIDLREFVSNVLRERLKTNGELP